MKKGNHHSLKTRAKMSTNHWSKKSGYIPPTKGMKFSEKQRKNMSLAHMGKIPWNKGKKGLQKHTEESKRKIGEFSRNRHHTEEAKRKVGAAHLGTHHSEQSKIKMRLSHLGKNSGVQNYKWKGGKSFDGRYIRILAPNHPFASTIKHVYEHRLVIEKIIGKYLNPREKVHHLNGNKIDNRPENLMAFKNERIHQLFENDHDINPSDIIFDGRILLP